MADANSASSQDVLDRIDREKENYLEELKEYIAIPSVSTDPAHADDVRRCSDFVLGQMTDAGLTAEKIETDGYPLVYGEWPRCSGQADGSLLRPLRCSAGRPDRPLEARPVHGDRRR